MSFLRDMLFAKNPFTFIGFVCEINFSVIIYFLMDLNGGNFNEGNVFRFPFLSTPVRRCTLVLKPEANMQVLTEKTFEVNVFPKKVD